MRKNLKCTANLRRFAKNSIAKLLSPVGLSVVNSKELLDLEKRYVFENHTKYKILKSSKSSNLNELLNYVSESKSQLCQDLFLLDFFNLKKNGFFVEFGATNGKDLSNTWLLEKHFGWTGILAEPAHVWRDELVRNRENSQIDFRCVWGESGLKLNFLEASSGELSTISEFASLDIHKTARANHVSYDVETVSLIDLLRQRSAPSVIDYLSIDTEGSEYDVLSKFDFNEFDIRVITCEHNYGTKRNDIFNLLIANGYRRVLEEISDFDDWYVKY